MNNWHSFIEEFSKNILTIYEKHENTFDKYDIHGRLHISRSLIFSEYMSRFYHNVLKINDIDFNAIRYAVAFHDSGRQGNGIDLWENDSSKICYSYLIDKYGSSFSDFSSSLIIKKNKDSNINKRIVTDSDVLEIMRPICGHGGRYGFNTKYFNFLKDNSEYSKFRHDLINEAWKLIIYTEDNKNLFIGNNYMYKLLDIIKNDDYSILKYILKD